MRSLTPYAVALTLTALAASPAAAQQAPSEDGTSASGPITILQNYQPVTGVHVSIGGSHVDDLATAAYDDITTLVHPGRNVLTIRWDQPIQKLNFKIAYAPTRNNFRNVIVVRGDASRDPALRAAGTRTLTFTIPT